MLKNKQLLITILIVIFLSSCFTEKEYINVQKIQNVEEFNTDAIIYSLPKTTIIVDVEVTKITQTKGPFSEYTEQLLGSIGNIIKQNDVEWKISDIIFYSYPQVDSSNIYVVNTNSNNFANCLNLTKEGFIFSVNKDINEEYNTYNILEKDLATANINENLAYGELSLDKNYKEVFDTIYRTEQTDTSVIRIPIVKKSIVRKSEKEQAEELAEEILILRDDRKALLVGEGDSEYLPDGKSLEIMINGLEQLEQQYLRMFVGKITYQTYHYRFEVTPTADELNSDIDLFRFSSGSGIVTWSNSFGEPVTLKIETQKSIQPIINYNNYKKENLKKTKKEKISGLFYRVPEKTTVLVQKDNKTLSKTDIYIAQFGTINSLPAKMFLNENNYGIEFYYDLGSIKKIEKK